MKRAIFSLACVFAFFGLPMATHAAQERIQLFDVDIQVRSDASIDVREKITYDFGDQQRYGIVRFLPERYFQKTQPDLYLPIEVESVTDESGQTQPYTVEHVIQEGDNQTMKKIRIGDPDTKITGVHTYVIQYHIDSIINGFYKHDELYWNITGNDWNVPIDSVRATVTLPDKSVIQKTACYTGYVNYTFSFCTDRFVSDTQATITNTTALLAGEGMTIVIGFDKGIVTLPSEIVFKPSLDGAAISLSEERIRYTTPLTIRVKPGEQKITLSKFLHIPFKETVQVEPGHTYRVTPVIEKSVWFMIVMWIIPIKIFLVGSFLLYFYWAKRGKDSPGKKTIIPQYEPPDGLTPAEISLIAHQIVSLQDISATMIHLAIKGYLHIRKEKEKIALGVTKKYDYTFIKQKVFSAEGDDLRSFELRILKALFGTSKKEVKLSDLRTTFSKHLPEIKSLLNSDIVKQGYFTTSPYRARLKMIAVGVFLLGIGIGGAFVLSPFFSPILFGVAFGLLAVQSFVYAVFMPQRTKEGTAAYQHILGFKRFLSVTEEERMQFHFDPKKFESSQEFFETYLPYAMVLKVEKKWVKQFSELEKPTWYDSDDQFSPILFMGALSSFSSAASHAVVASSSGGAGGSGFSDGSVGGGFGGGGGGSW